MVSASGTAKSDVRAAKFLGNPGQGQARLAQRLPERRLPGACLVVVDGLRVGEIGKDFLRRLDDNVLTLRHGVSPHPIGASQQRTRPVLKSSMMGKSIPSDKHGCRYARLRVRHERRLIPRNSAMRSFAFRAVVW
jgi:hypothetical protein